MYRWSQSVRGQKLWNTTFGSEFICTHLVERSSFQSYSAVAKHWHFYYALSLSSLLFTHGLLSFILFVLSKPIQHLTSCRPFNTTTGLYTWLIQKIDAGFSVFSYLGKLSNLVGKICIGLQLFTRYIVDSFIFELTVHAMTWVLIPSNNKFSLVQAFPSNWNHKG